MKNTRLMLLLFVLLLLPIAFKNVAYAGQEASNSDIIEGYYPEDYQGYQYPVLPGMESWPYGNHGEMVNVCQIPDEILQSMTTDQLVESVLYYPLYADLLAYNSPQEAYQILKTFVPAFDELSKRTDCSESLYKYFSSHREKMLTDLAIWQNSGFAGVHANPYSMILFLAEQGEFADERLKERTAPVRVFNQSGESTDSCTEENRDLQPVTFTGNVTQTDNGSATVLSILSSSGGIILCCRPVILQLLVFFVSFFEL